MYSNCIPAPREVLARGDEQVVVDRHGSDGEAHVDDGLPCDGSFVGEHNEDVEVAFWTWPLASWTSPAWCCCGCRTNSQPR